MTSTKARPALIDVPRRLLTARLEIRPFEHADAQELFERIDASRASLGPWLPWVEETTDADDLRETIARMRGRWETREDLAVGVFRRDDGRLLGGSGLHRIDWDLRGFEIGYWLATEAEGRGYMSECAAALTRMAFEALDAWRVEIRVDPENVRSIAIPRRLGFALEGTLRRSMPGDEPGVPRDQAVFAIVRGDELPPERDPAATSWS